MGDQARPAFPEPPQADQQPLPDPWRYLHECNRVINNWMGILDRLEEENFAFSERQEQLNAEIEEHRQELEEIDASKQANNDRIRRMRDAVAGLGPVFQQLERACESPERN